MSQDENVPAFRAPLELQIDYARELNEQQLSAVTAPPGPALVIAGAGSGKTRTLTYRVAFLLEQGIPPERILLLTFTNKAAKEMMRRVVELVGQELRELWGGTFHSIANRILRRHAPLVGYERDFIILDREDARHLLVACLKEAGIDTKPAEAPKADALGEVFSFAANTRRSWLQILAEEKPDWPRAVLEKVYQRYEERKRASNALDFDDLLVLWLRLLEEQPAIREQYQRRFQFILVDEYQDTNQLQSGLIDLLAARHHNLMVVGDDAQSIYAWRGANFKNILDFPRRYPEATIYKIETNYRSTPEILQVANAAIQQNVLQFSKELSPARRAGSRPVVVVLHDAAQQGAFVAAQVAHLHEDEGTGLGRMVVLYRSHFHALELQLELRKRRIPFSIASGIRYFEQAHIKDVIAYLKLVFNARDEVSFKRLVQLLPGIGSKAAEKLWAAFESWLPEKGAVDVSGGAAPQEQSLAARLQRCGASVPGKATVAWAQWVATMAQVQEEAKSGGAGGMIRLVLQAGYEDYLKGNYDHHESRLDDLRELAAFGSRSSTLEEFLTELALLTDLEAEDDRPASEADQLRLSTIHQAKGLEFDVVFVIMLCEGLFPNARAAKTAEGMEEERRLMYVAITRARNELYLSYPLYRDGPQQPSRFLNEIPKALVEEWPLR